jgi:hypothetical protein
LEIELFKGKESGHVLQERGLATMEQVCTGMDLLSSVANNLLSPNEAAIALNLVFTTNTTVYAAMSEVRDQREQDVNTRLADLLIDSDVCRSIDLSPIVFNNPDSAIKVGRKLLKSGLLNESILFSALRLQTCLRLGYVSRDSAVSLLSYCHMKKVSLDQSFEDNEFFVPGRVQWLWC